AVELEAVGGDVELRVRDTGVGIASNDLPRVFDRFHRIEGVAARTQEGSGIGLALVKELVAIHGGTIAAASAPGEGSTFTVRMPGGHARQPESRPPSPPATAPSLSTVAAPYVEEALRWLPSPPGRVREGDAAAPGATARVLVADDNADMRE